MWKWYMYIHKYILFDRDLRSWTPRPRNVKYKPPMPSTFPVHLGSTKSRRETRDGGSAIFWLAYCVCVGRKPWCISFYVFDYFSEIKSICYRYVYGIPDMVLQNCWSLWCNCLMSSYDIVLYNPNWNMWNKVITMYVLYCQVILLPSSKSSLQGFLTKWK